MMEEIQDVDGCVWRNMREAFWGDKVLCLCEMVDSGKKRRYRFQLELFIRTHFYQHIPSPQFKYHRFGVQTHSQILTLL